MSPRVLTLAHRPLGEGDALFASARRHGLDLEDGTILIEALVPRPFEPFEAATRLQDDAAHPLEVHRVSAPWSRD